MLPLVDSYEGLSPLKGIYVLIISVSEDIEVTIGSLGGLLFHKGVYAYVGSAKKYLEKRIKRHLRKDKLKFWHIDYLLCDKAVKATEVFWKEADKKEECKIARNLLQIAVPVVNFGCSDCRCTSHLFWLGDSADLDLDQLFTSKPICMSRI